MSAAAARRGWVDGSPAGTKGVWKRGDTLRYRLVDDSPYTRAGANSLTADGQVLWYSASADPRERAVQDAAAASKRLVFVTRNAHMRSGEPDSDLGWFRHTGESKTVLFNRRERVSYRLLRQGGQGV